jgi:hypothetical protein
MTQEALIMSRRATVSTLFNDSADRLVQVYIAVGINARGPRGCLPTPQANNY